MPPKQKPTTPTLPPSLATSIAAATSRSICSKSTLPTIAMPRALRFGVVADVEAFLDVVEDRRRDREIALGRELVGDRADMRVDAEDLLHDDDAAARACRLGSARQARMGPAPSGFSSIQAHFDLLPFERTSMRRAARASLRDGDAADDQHERDDVIGRERFAEQTNRHDRAEHRHQIDEHARPARPDQFDAAHEE